MVIKMEKKKLELRMRQLELMVHYHFNQIAWLSKAMEANLVEIPGEGKNHKEYSNEALATVGDTILKSVIADKLYKEGKHVKGVITSEKSDVENNDAMYRLVNEYKVNGMRIIDFAYKDNYFYDESPDNDKVSNPQHTPYIEAIIAAVYYDSNYDTTKRWILKFLLPLLGKYK